MIGCSWYWLCGQSAGQPLAVFSHYYIWRVLTISSPWLACSSWEKKKLLSAVLPPLKKTPKIQPSCFTEAV